MSALAKRFWSVSSNVGSVNAVSDPVLRWISDGLLAHQCYMYYGAVRWELFYDQALTCKHECKYFRHTSDARDTSWQIQMDRVIIAEDMGPKLYLGIISSCLRSVQICSFIRIMKHAHESQYIQLMKQNINTWYSKIFPLSHQLYSVYCIKCDHIRKNIHVY